MKGFFREYFIHTRGEIRSIVIILIILSASAAFRIIESKRDPPAINVDLLNQISELVNSFEERKAVEMQHIPSKNWSREIKDNQVILLKSFDPNIAGIDELQSIGLKKEIGLNIVRYRNAGGKFRNPDDVRKIYGMTDSIFNIYREYITIRNTASKEPVNEKYSPTPIEEPQIIFLELNTADTTGLKTLRGIGSVFASRIIRYRERLGGYHSHEQLNEITGMDSLKQSLLKMQTSIDPSAIRRININEADETELRSHPYVTPHVARSLIYYRRAAGKIESLEELTENGVLPQEELEKCMIYFCLEELSKQN